MGNVMKCVLQHEGKFYIEKQLVFGTVDRTIIFQQISDSVRFILREKGISVELN